MENKEAGKGMEKLTAEEVKDKIWGIVEHYEGLPTTTTEALYTLFDQYTRQIAGEAFEAGYSRASGVFNDHQSPDKQTFIDGLFKK